MAFKSEGKDIYSMLVFAKCCWSKFSQSVCWSLAWQERAHRTEKSRSHTTSAVPRQINVPAQLVQHLPN